MQPPPLFNPMQQQQPAGMQQPPPPPPMTGAPPPQPPQQQAAAGSAFNAGQQPQQPLFYNNYQQPPAQPAQAQKQQPFAPQQGMPQMQQQPPQVQQQQQFEAPPAQPAFYAPQGGVPGPSPMAAPPMAAPPMAAPSLADPAPPAAAPAVPTAAVIRPPDILPASDPYIPSSDRNVFMQTGQLNPEEENRAMEQQQMAQQHHQQDQQGYYGASQYGGEQQMQYYQGYDAAATAGTVAPSVMGYAAPPATEVTPQETPSFEQREPIDGNNEEDAQQPPPPQQVLPQEQHYMPEDLSIQPPAHDAAALQQHDAYGQQRAGEEKQVEHQQPQDQQYQQQQYYGYADPPMDDVNSLPMDRLVLGQSDQPPDNVQPTLPPAAESAPAENGVPADVWGNNQLAPPPMSVPPPTVSPPTASTSRPGSQPTSPLPPTTVPAAVTPAVGTTAGMSSMVLTSTPTMPSIIDPEDNATEEIPPASQRAEAVGSDRRDESVMGPPPTGPVPTGKRDVTGADTPPAPLVTNGLSASNANKNRDHSDLDEDRESERSRDFDAKDSSKRHQRDRRDHDRHRDYDRQGKQHRRRRSRSQSADGEDSSAEDRNNRKKNSQRRRDESSPPPPMQRRGSDRHRNKDSSRRDDRRRDGDRSHRDHRDRDYHDDRSYRDDNRSVYDDANVSSRRSESGRHNESRYNRSRYDDSYYNRDRESSRPSSRAGSIYEERYLDRDRYRDNRHYQGGANASMLYPPGYASHHNPYGMSMAQPYVQQSQYPAMMPDRAAMDTFEKHWRYYLTNPVAFEELKTSNKGQYDSLNTYYNLIGDYLRLPPIPAAPIKKKEEENRASSRASVHSGQSDSAADVGAAALGAEQPQSGQFSRPDSRQALEQSTIYGDPNADPRYQPTIDYGVNGGEYDQASSSMQYPSTVDPHARMTPVKFASPHVKGAFGPLGTFAKVDAKSPLDGQSALIELHSLQVLLREEAQELTNFPGPLVPGRTHKGEVIQFCQSKISAAKDASASIVDIDSYVLLWELLILLLRQKNAIDGSDIAELLLKDRDVHSPYTTNTKNKEGDSTAEDSSSAVDREELTTVTKANRTLISPAASDEPITQHFRDYLLYGHKKEGLEYAMKHGLWGHALFLASKMDERSYSNVMLRFANGLAVNDPLQTLYQSMSGRQPIAVKECAEKNWGDWRPHLAMILSNPSSKEGLDGRSIVTLGDTLFNKGFLYASHFCYLMANVDFGTHSSAVSKLVLVGSDRTLSFDQFATNEAIQCTEIFEYIQKLGNPDYHMMSLQYFKFVYAVRMLDCGLSSSALYYLEQISAAIVKRPAEVQGDRLEDAVFIEQVMELSERLKFLDPMYTTREGEVSEMGDPEWLTLFKNAVYSTNYYGQEQAQQEYEYEQQDQQQQPDQPHQQNDNYAGDTNAWNGYQEPQPAAQHTDIQSQLPPQQPQFDPTTQEPLMMRSIPEEQTADQHSQQSSAQHSPVKTVPPPPGGEGGYFSHVQPQAPPPSALQSPPVSAAPPTSAFKPMPPNSRVEPAAAANNNNNAKSDADKKKAAAAAAAKKANEKSPQPGMFGRLLGKFIKPPNQMHLPEDKGDSIIWDEDKKCWVDKNADPAEEAAKQVKPPSDMELMPSSGPPSLGAPGGPPGGLPPMPGANKFAVGGLAKRGARARVDVFKNSQSAPSLAPQDAPAPMIPPMVPEMGAPAAAPQMMFVPPPVEGASNGHDQQQQQPHEPQQQQQQQQPDAAPAAAGQPMMFFNPNQFAGANVAAPPPTS